MFYLYKKIPHNTGKQNLRIVTGFGDSMRGMFNFCQKTKPMRREPSGREWTLRYLEESDTAFRLPLPVAVAILAVFIYILVDSHRQANQSRHQRALASSIEMQRLERIECGRLVETWQELRPLNESKQVALGSTKQEAAEDHATQQSEYSTLCQQLGISPYLTNLN